MQPPHQQIEVDRPRAAVRGFLRLLVATVLGFAIWIPLFDVPWRVLWAGQPASFFALASLVLLAACIAVIVSWSAIRWLALAVWPKPTQIELSPEQISLRLGPFGEHVCPRSRMSISVDSGLDPDVLEHLPDDAVLLRARDLDTGRDLFETILRFGRTTPGELVQMLRPYLHGMDVDEGGGGPDMRNRDLE
jgi:hypothetical protein